MTVGLRDFNHHTSKFIARVRDGETMLAARYETTKILTVDQRHFRAIAPLTGEAEFTLPIFDTV